MPTATGSPRATPPPSARSTRSSSRPAARPTSSSSTSTKPRTQEIVMSNLLHIQASPRGDRSASITVARQFIAAYQAAHPGDTVETLDLWSTELPEFDGPTQEGKYAIMNGQKFTPEQEYAWGDVVRVAEHFKSFDKFVFSVPMWNFSIPYKLKHWIDVITQPGLAF